MFIAVFTNSPHGILSNESLVNPQLHTIFLQEIQKPSRKTSFSLSPTENLFSFHISSIRAIWLLNFSYIFSPQTYGMKSTNYPANFLYVQNSMITQ